MFVLCGMLGTTPVKQPASGATVATATTAPTTPSGTTPDAVPAAAETPTDPPAPTRYAIAREQTSRVGEMEADIVSVVRCHLVRSGGLVLTVHFCNTPPDAALKLYDGSAEPTLTAKGSGGTFLQVTDCYLLAPIKPTAGKATLLFKARSTQDYLLRLPVEVGGVKASFRFLIPAAIQPPVSYGPLKIDDDEPFTRNASVDASPPAAKPTVAPPKPVPEPARTIIGSAKAPVAGGRRVSHVEDYEANDQPGAGAKGIYAAARLIADDDVCLFAEPTTCVVEGTPAKGWLSVRPTDGPHKGKLLAVREAGVGAAK